jgi:BetI-type transcriptional repressor, C-terminal
MLFERGVPVALGNISLVEVAERIQRTTGAAYNIWPSQTDFHRDLAILVSADTDYETPEIVRNVLDEGLRQGLHWRELLRRYCNAYAESVSRRREFFVTIHFVAVALDEPLVARALRHSYASIHENTSALLQSMMSVHHLELIPTYTFDQITWMISAVTEGFLMRASIDPHIGFANIDRSDHPESPTGWTAFALSVERLITSMTRESNLDASS